jgi:hypothetical protein
MSLQAPFPWFGGKSRAAGRIWQALGDVPNYVEPFAGSLAVLLQRPTPPRLETVNDRDGFLCNVWRALQADPEEVAFWCDRPANEADQHAIHTWLVAQREEFTARLMGDPDYYDAKIAGRWLYGICCWIGSGWCSGKGPWQSVDGKLTYVGDAGQGVHRQLVHLGDAGRGVHRKRVHLGNAGQGVHRQLVHLGTAGRGVHRKLVHLGDAGQGIHTKRAWGDGLYTWFEALRERLRHVRVCCGDWTRVLGPSPTTKLGLTGVVLDPPYAHAERTSDLYRIDTDVSAAVRAWALAHGDDPQLRIVLCGYDGEHAMPDTWQAIPWKAPGGYGNQGRGRGRANAAREMLWCSPACLPVAAGAPRRCA